MSPVAERGRSLFVSRRVGVTSRMAARRSFIGSPVLIVIAALPAAIWAIANWGSDGDGELAAPPSAGAVTTAPASTGVVVPAPASSSPPAPVDTVAPPASALASATTAAPLAAPATQPLTPTTPPIAPAQSASPPVATAPPVAVTAPPPTAAPATVPETAPETAPAAIPAAVAATTPGSEPTEALSPSEADRFIRGYYAEVQAGDYDVSWSQLSPEFQRGKAISFDYYVRFWNENDVEVGAVRLVSSGERDATLHVDLRWNGSGAWLTEELALRRHDGRWLIAAQTTIG